MLDASSDFAAHNNQEDSGSALFNLFGNLAFPLAVIGVLFFLSRRSGGMGGPGGPGFPLQFGQSKAKFQMEPNTGVTFDDVAGVDEAKQNFMEVVEYLKKPEWFTSVGARTPKGFLLIGPLGTGKTLLAKAIAGEAGVPFFSISGSEFVEMFVGIGASRVRDLFKKAKENAPCIVFVDEIDAVGRQRGTGIGGGNDEREQTLNQLLTEMDGFEGNTGVIVVAATNRADILDSALLRPGRFDRQVAVDVLDIRGRTEILKVHANNKKFENDVSLEVIAMRTPGFSGADLANLLNEAAMLAGRRGRTGISGISLAFCKWEAEAYPLQRLQANVSSLGFSWWKLENNDHCQCQPFYLAVVNEDSSGDVIALKHLIRLLKVAESLGHAILGWLTWNRMTYDGVFSGRLLTVGMQNKYEIEKQTSYIGGRRGYSV